MLVTGPADLDPAGLEPITIAPALLNRLAAIRSDVLRTLATGRPVYGVNTGMGALSKHRLTEDEQRVHQRNLLLGRAVGGPPWLPADEVRAVLIGRLRTFLTGDAGVSVGLIQQLVDAVNSGRTPEIPVGGAGSAGEIIPLAHAFGGLDLELGPKEGIALLAGIPGTTGRAALHASRVRRLSEHLTAVAAGAIAVIGANRDPYHPLTARTDDVLAAEHTRLRELAGPEAAPRSLQAPVSFRVAGHVIAHVRRTLAHLESAVDRAFDGVTDSPAYLDGEFIGTAGFHGVDLAAHCDHLTAALAHAAEVSAARLHRLLDPGVTGLTAQLAHDPGPQAGLVAVHKRAVATGHALRRLTSPSASSTAETSNGQEDVQSFSWEAVGVLAEAVRLTREVTACELLAVHQAFALSERPVPPRLRELLAGVAAVVPPIAADRPFGADLTRLLDSVLRP
ncbi:phenylalanine/histidine ammonia-lyase [Kribbella turkmenica]|uniref:Phenylalanine/histidine ammonia-lyase n=1 Tax=Kribbella turkmenica TaxID=2530375 RepID=A0A4R4WIF3_9ACTN|nr:aromatic amino acid lyase [Kribbella turkmenica]TDD18762.1 phenylalanine/histidine ammonia-lyase [Kribbella turkmenica]